MRFGFLEIDYIVNKIGDWNMDETRKKEIQQNVEKHCSVLTPQERESFKEFMIENDDLMKELAKL